MNFRKYLTEWVLRGAPVAVLSVALWCGSYVLVGLRNDVRDLNRLVDEEVIPLSEHLAGENRIAAAFDSVLTRAEQRSGWVGQALDSMEMKGPRSKRNAHWRRLAIIADSVARMVARDSTRMAAAEVSARTPVSVRYAQSVQVALGRDRRRWEALSRLSRAAISHEGEDDAFDAYRAAADDYEIAFSGASDMLQSVRLEADRRRARFDEFQRRYAIEDKQVRWKMRASIVGFALSVYFLQGMVMLALTGRWNPRWDELRASRQERRGAGRPRAYPDRD